MAEDTEVRIAALNASLRTFQLEEFDGDRTNSRKTWVATKTIMRRAQEFENYIRTGNS